MEAKKKKIFYCKVELTLDIIGGKWKPLIIYHLGKAKVVRYGALKRKIPNINERVLSRQLRELEEQKIINRKDYHEKPLRVEYSLTEVGKTLLPIIMELADWGEKYNQDFDYGEIDFVDEYDDE